ncbi:hypothetical protein KUV22_17085 [Microbulbifer agarilyticus]|uniref:hypothetical protein n=1 Tax=Microbulbifer agarilyticus TaxID=260552 RepID=UPI001C93FEAC|nr:hypothetical protein [Microbulbifer agarilyticus]MBY6192139.1 hypothetical protein [Microbulbifer agarilyticus]
MKKLFLLFSTFVMSGCVTTATVVACATSSDKFPGKERYNLSLAAEIETEKGSQVSEIPVLCIYKDRKCGGGDWYFEWNQRVEEDLSFNLGAEKSLLFDVPSCTTLLQYVGEEYPHGDSSIISSGQIFPIGNADLSKSQAKAVYGVRLVNYSITESGEAPNL